MQWTLGGVTVEMDSEYSVASASTSDSGEYTCVARNIRGESAATLDLTVEGILYILCTYMYMLMTTQFKSSTNSMAIPACVCLPHFYLKRFMNMSYFKVCLPNCILITQLYITMWQSCYVCKSCFLRYDRIQLYTRNVNKANVCITPHVSHSKIDVCSESEKQHICDVIL